MKRVVVYVILVGCCLGLTSTASAQCQNAACFYMQCNDWKWGFTAMSYPGFNVDTDFAGPCLSACADSPCAAAGSACGNLPSTIHYADRAGGGVLIVRNVPRR